MPMRRRMLALVALVVTLYAAAQARQMPVRVGGPVRAPTKIVDAQPV
jgi:hypothetical protein